MHNAHGRLAAQGLLNRLKKAHIGYVETKTVGAHAACPVFEPERIKP
jgi:hypothetical protein